MRTAHKNRICRDYANINVLLAIVIQNENYRQLKQVRAKRIALIVDCFVFIIIVCTIFLCYDIVRD